MLTSVHKKCFETALTVKYLSFNAELQRHMAAVLLTQEYLASAR